MEILNSHDPGTLCWDLRKGPGLDGLAAEYRSGAYQRVILQVPADQELADLDVLLRLRALRAVRVEGPVADDTAAFRLPGLEYLALLTGCRLPVPRLDLPKLSALSLQGRPGLRTLADLTDLRRLHLANWPGEDLAFLGWQPRLQELFVEGRRQTCSLRGVEEFPDLRHLRLMSLRVDSLAPLLTVGRIRQLLISGPDRAGAGGDAVLDLADLRRLERLSSLRLVRAGAVRSLLPLVSMPTLSELRLVATGVEDQDFSVLATLARGGVLINWTTPRPRPDSERQAPAQSGSAS